MKRRKADDHVLGARHLSQFDFCIIGSGAGGSTAAHILTAAGKTVLILEAGPNAYPDLDGKVLPLPLHSNDELKYAVRGFISQQAYVEPRTFRQSTMATAAVMADVNTLPKAVGGAFQHADCKTPRFNAVDFRLKSTMEALIAATPGLAVPGFGATAGTANFADWPFTYDDLEPFYDEVEQLYGVQGDATDNPFASPRSRPFPMPPGVPMFLALRLASGARATSFPGRPAQSPHLPCGHRLALHRRRAPALRRLRAVQRLRLPQQLEGRTAGDHAASRAPLRKVPAALRGAGDPSRELGTDRHRGTVHRRRRRAADRHGQRLHARRQPDRIGAALPALRQPRQLERPGRPEPHVPLPDERERLPARARARPARPRRHPRHLGLPRRRARRRHHPRGTGRRWAARLHGRHLRVRRVAGSPHHRGRKRLRVPAPRVARAPLRRRTQERVARRGPWPTPVRPHHAGGGRTAAQQHGRSRSQRARRVRATGVTGNLRPARLREGLPRVLRAVPAPGRSERRGAHRCRLRRPM